DRRSRALDVVDVDVADLRPARGSATEDDRHAPGDEMGGQGIVEMVRGEEHAVDVAGRQVALDPPLFGRRLGHEEDQGKPRRAELRADPAKKPRKERVVEEAAGRFRNDETHGIAPAGDEAPGCGVWYISKAIDRSFDGTPGIGVDPLVAIDDTRDGRPRDSGREGDGVEGRAAPVAIARDRHLPLFRVCEGSRESALSDPVRTLHPHVKRAISRSGRPRVRCWWTGTTNLASG